MSNTEATKIAVLQEGHKQMTVDITEIKADIKEIKKMLVSSFVPFHEFESYKEGNDKALVLAKKSAMIKLIVAVLITVIITSLVGYFVQNVTKDTTTLKTVTSQEQGK
jgi:predicted permease